MASPDTKGRSRTATITDIRSGFDLARDFPHPIAILKGRQQVMGDRRIRETWYPLITQEENAMVVGQKVMLTRKTEPFGKGSHTSTTLRKI